MIVEGVLFMPNATCQHLLEDFDLSLLYKQLFLEIGFLSVELLPLLIETLEQFLH